ncbi:MAG TPA: thiamine pyrophosphate-dependent enzyme [Steroidobacteraceae bacterium]|nr:thiamine pyrophosphate-dependent enzyme [Steroidobacteraceae bacterium]
MTLRTGGEAIVDALVTHGVDTVFGLPGAQTYGLFDALERAQPQLKTIGARHEQACSLMALGYARATGRPSVCTVVPGPGVLNAGAGLLTAFGGNQPVLCVTGQVPRAFLDKGRGHLHEMPNQLETLRGFTKWAERIDEPVLAPVSVARAFQQMISGRPGPAALEMPWDVFTLAQEVEPCAPLPRLEPPAPDPQRIEEAARLIAASRAPMIFVGGGAFAAADEVRALAERIDAPVVAFRSGRGILSDAHELGLTIAAAYRLWPQTDVMIGIGTRLEAPLWRWPFRPAGLKSVRIDIDPAEMLRFSATVAVLADAREGTRALAAELARANRPRPAWREAIARARAAADADIQSIQPQVGYLKALREVLPQDGIVTDEICQVGFASWYGFPVYLPRTFIASGYQGTLGSGYATALGAKVAHPERAVVAICGDGGFLFTVEELATAAQFGIGVVALVFNNEGFGNVRRDQQQRFAGRLLGCDLVNPDFMRLAEAFGIAGARVDSPQGLARALERALADARPALIEIPVPRGSESDPWRFIHPPKPEGSAT